jgi:hypothetical protein
MPVAIIDVPIGTAFAVNDRLTNDSAKMPIMDIMNVIVLVFTDRIPPTPSFFYNFIRLIGDINKDTMTV